MVLPVLCVVIAVERKPHVDSLEVDTGEPARRDSDDGKSVRAEIDRLTDRIVGRPEFPSPELVSQNGDPRGADDVVLGHKQAPTIGCDPQEGEQRRGCEHRPHALGLFTVSQRPRRARKCRHRLE